MIEARCYLCGYQGEFPVISEDREHATAVVECTNCHSDITVETMG